MWRYLEGAKPPPAKKPKLTDEEKKHKKQLYEKSERSRHFIPKWDSDFPWLQFDLEHGKMFCKICTAFPQAGTNNQVDYLFNHLGITKTTHASFIENMHKSINL